MWTVMFVFQVQQLNHMDEVCYESVLKQIMAGHQVFFCFVLFPFRTYIKKLNHHSDVLGIILL